jgi:hypothetical protein
MSINRKTFFVFSPFLMIVALIFVCLGLFAHIESAHAQIL